MAMEKTFDAAKAEGRIYKAWEDSGAFKAGANASRKETFTIMIPPPNVTGALHVGHAFNNTLQDILVRWHRMRGFDTLWQPGQDHAGIATQLQVEKKLKEESNLRRTDMSRDEFLSKVWEWKDQYGNTIIEQLKRLGSSCDWSRNAFTMSGAPNAPAGNEGNFHDAVIKVFVEMYNKGLIYRGKRLVNWDPHFETAISDLEVENIETPGHMWHFKYPLAGGATYEYLEKDEDGNVTFREVRDYISIATTRPETMLGDGAVAVHPSDQRYAPIVGQLCEIPVGPKEHRRLIPIITDEYPDPDFGSGAVKITGAHDFNDYQVAKRGGIPMYRLMDTKGAMRADGASYEDCATIAMAVAKGEKTLTEAEADAINLVPEDLRGLDRFEARKLVVDQITSEGLAVMVPAPAPEPGPREDGEEAPDQARGAADMIPYVENKPIMQPFGDRSKVVIEPMLTDQWFVRTDRFTGPDGVERDFAGDALRAVRDGRVKIMPESGEKTYYHWLENIEPWCISRQLWWGHQIPVWYGQPEGDDRELIPFCGSNFEEIESHALEYYSNHYQNVSLKEYSPDEQVTEPDEFKYEPFTKVNPETNSAEIFLMRDPDVLDTWFSSGLWPIGTLGWPNWDESTSKYFPTDVLVTGQDILFFWVARMMMMQLAVVDEIPFHTVYLHGLVRDEKGKKMSKTTGNVIDPLVIIDEFGADALRFTNTAMASIGGVLKLSTDRIKGYRNFGTKLWNAFSFADHYQVPFAPENTRPDAQNTLNKWIIGETAKTLETVDEALNAYRFNDAALALYAFTWGTVCDWYVELTKPILQGDDASAKAETEQTLAWVLDQCLIMLHPIMPFITEELWGISNADRPKMLIHADWPTYTTDLVDADADREMNWVITLIENVRSVRAQMHVPAGLHVPLVVSSLDANGQAAWDNNESMIKRLARVDSLTQAAEFPKGTATIAVEGGTFGLPLADIIDVDAEKARLEKSLGKLAKELGGLRGRLNNPKFVASAPDEVVAESRELLTQKEEEEAALKSALARLAELG
ncbi:MAG: valine--tRNA ligase [Paracoccaceae bacterium]|nr:valine--tRNA ligase [Paracoccaceae bacterium]MDP7185731.1 valine--tRNA ligase [Paracoccaceae bacterium]